MDLTEEIEYFNCYWVSGHLPKGSLARNEVSDPPVSGWSHVFVRRTADNPNVLVFCPYKLRGFYVSKKSAEVLSFTEPTEGDGIPLNLTPERRHRIIGRITLHWHQHQKMGWAADYNEAAIILKGLGEDVPTIILQADGTEDTKSRGGKETAPALLKPVNEGSKRGVFLKYFLADEGNKRSVRETMAELQMSRSNVLSYLYMLNKDHGLGYDLVGDAVTIYLPDEADPFTGETPKKAKPAAKSKAKAKTPDPAEEDDDDAWLQ